MMKRPVVSSVAPLATVIVAGVFASSLKLSCCVNLKVPFESVTSVPGFI